MFSSSPGIRALHILHGKQTIDWYGWEIFYECEPTPMNYVEGLQVQIFKHKAHYNKPNGHQ